MPALTGYLLLGTSTVLFAGGTWLLKHAADTREPMFLLASFAVLAAANLVFMPILADGFSKGVVASSLASQILALAIGKFYYAEPVSLEKALGFGCAIAALWLMSASASTTTTT